MRTKALETMLSPTGDQLLTTGEAAAILNTSRQHVVDLCDRGDLPFVTTGSHRRVLRSDVESLQSRTQRLTRDQRRSLWLGYAIAGKIVADPEGAIAKAKDNLTRLQEAHARGGASRRLSEWERLLDGPVHQVLEVLTSPSPRARELRQNSPFAGVLSERERKTVVGSFDEGWGARS